MTGGNPNKQFFELLGGTGLESRAGETVEFDGPANLWRGLEAVGGWLWCTNERLVFRPHKVNVQNQAQSWDRDAIVGAKKANTLFIVPNGLLIKLQDGTSAKFVVNDRKRWLSTLSVEPPSR